MEEWKGRPTAANKGERREHKRRMIEERRKQREEINEIARKRIEEIKARMRPFESIGVKTDSQNDDITQFLIQGVIYPNEVVVDIQKGGLQPLGLLKEATRVGVLIRGTEDDVMACRKDAKKEGYLDRVWIYRWQNRLDLVALLEKARVGLKPDLCVMELDLGDFSTIEEWFNKGFLPTILCVGLKLGIKKAQWCECLEKFGYLFVTINRVADTAFFVKAGRYNNLLLEEVDWVTE